MRRTGSLWWSAPATACRFSTSSLLSSLVVLCKEPRRKERRLTWGSVHLWSVRDSDHYLPTDLPGLVCLVADLAHLCGPGLLVRQAVASADAPQPPKPP